MTLLAIDLNPIDDAIDGLGGLVGGAAEAAGEAILSVVVEFAFGLIADAVTSVTNSVIAAMTATTSIDLDGGFFAAITPIRQIVLGMSVALVLAFFLAAVIRALAAGEPGAVIRTALVDVPASMLLMAMSVTVAWILIRVVDAASLAVTGDVGEAMGEVSATLATVELLTGAGLLGLIFGLLFVIGALLVWLQLLVRTALIYIVIVLAPLGFATRAHPGTRQIARRTIEMAVALIVSKFGIAVAFGVGAVAIESSNGVGAGEDVDLSGMLAGVAVMLMAAFMPWLIWKAFPLVEAAGAAAGVERAPIRAAVAGASMAVAATVGVSTLAGGAGAGASSGGGGGGGASGGSGGAGGGGGSGPVPGVGAGGGSPPVHVPSSGSSQSGGSAPSGGSGGGAAGSAIASAPRRQPSTVVVPVEDGSDGSGHGGPIEGERRSR
ncbi:MAG: hypothetical protein R2770_00765 [Acidimicrobiales bacterium]